MVSFLLSKSFTDIDIPIMSIRDRTALIFFCNSGCPEHLERAFRDPVRVGDV